MVDDEDFEWLNQFKWHATIRDHRIYARRNVGKYPSRSSLLMHRVLVDAPEGMVIDHINRNTLDNRRSNLRICSFVQNVRNQRIRKNNTSGFKGVQWNKNSNKWLSYIWSGRPIYLGSFLSPIDAAKAYDQAAKLHFGEFASPNF
jgi:HNH endonuclease/AP2 domain